MDAVVYLRVQPGEVEDVVVALAAKHGVRYATAVVGEWDVMVSVEAADMEALARIVLREIQAIPGVLRSLTAPVVPLDMIGIHGGGWAMPGLPLQRRGSACYVHISADSGAVVGIVEALAEIEHVKGVAVTAGRHDVLAEIDLPWEQASRVILESIHVIPGVRGTDTAIAVPPIEAVEEDLPFGPD